MPSRAVIRDFMTASPHTIGANQNLARAHALMRDNGIRHLPVLHGGKLVGIITDRDIHLVETLSDVEPSLVTVLDAMTASVYAVSPETPLEEVAQTMAEHKYGSAVVMGHNKVIGIFTTVDACRALASWVASNR